MRQSFRRTISLMLTLVLLASVLLPALTQPVSALYYSGSAGYMSGKYYRALTQVTLTGDPRTDIVNVAKSQVGYQEGGSGNQLSGEVFGSVNYTEYGYWYGAQDMWCAMFASWCAHVAGIGTDVIPKHSYTPDGLLWFRNRGRAYSRSRVAAGEYTPQPGDLIYFKSARNRNSTNHVGIVTGYADGVVYTIEGNSTAASIFTNGGTVSQKSYPITNTYIVYICSPDYQRTGLRVPEEPTAHWQLEDLRRMIYQIETGGDGNYDRVTDAYGVITVGSGQWFGNEARELLMRIRKADPVGFNQADTAGIGRDLDAGSWQNYRICADSDKMRAISRILGSEAGIRVQDEMMDEKLEQYRDDAVAMGVRDMDAQLLCAGLRHLGGSAMVRQVLSDSAGDYSAEAICAALEKADSGFLRIGGQLLCYMN